MLIVCGAEQTRFGLEPSLKNLTAAVIVSTAQMTVLQRDNCMCEIDYRGADCECECKYRVGARLPHGNGDCDRWCDVYGPVANRRRHTGIRQTNREILRGMPPEPTGRWAAHVRGGEIQSGSENAAEGP